MLDAFLMAVANVAVWPNPLLILTGTLLGLLFGIIPGLSGAVAIAMMIPLTFTMDLTQAMLLLLSTLGGSAFGGSVSAILIGIPGTSVSAATVFDGHALAKQGRADLAIGAAATSSALGALLGLGVLVGSIPILISVLLLFGPAEVFMLTFFALTIIALAVEGTFVASLLSGMIGILLSFHGFVTVVGGQRFTFGTAYLWDGIPLLPVFIGLFAVAGGIELLLGGPTVARAFKLGLRRQWWRGVFDGIVSVFRNMRAFFTGTVVGVVIGIVPGVGGTVSNMLAYTLTRQYSKEPETYGKGNVAGVIASEASNDAKDGAALMPTLALGVPGSEVMAILLGAFVLHGIQPGRAMLVNHLDVVFVIILALAISNILTSSIGICLARQLIRVTAVPVKLYAPPIIVISLAGAYSVHGSMVDMWVAVIFGVIGFAMKRLAYSRVALVIGLVLGQSTEEAFFQAIQVSRGSYMVFLERPISLGLAILLVTFIIIFLVRSVRRARLQSPAIRIENSRNQAREE